MAVSRLPEKVAQRKLKGHRKSRLGCRNCKLRRVKCDETRPSCSQCLNFRVACNYSTQGSDLQASHDTITDLGSPMPQTCSANETTLSVINESFSQSSTAYELDMHDLDRLSRFQTRTILTMGTANSVSVHQKEVFRLACAHPLVMHAVMALVAKHDRFISGSPYGAPTIFETYHVYQAASLLNRKLSKHLQADDCDAVGAVSSLMGALAIASIEAAAPEDAWPLKPASPDDLQWLKLSDGKKELFKIADPFRPESCFRSFIDEYVAESHTTDQTKLAVDKLPPQLLNLCDLKVVSNPGNNPYYTAVQVLATLRDLECNHSNCLRFFSFINDMHRDFRDLLECKDPHALLLMAFWYAKVCHYQWWIARRTMMECKAICIYLERHYASETAIQELLLFPKMRCGLVVCE